MIDLEKQKMMMVICYDQTVDGYAIGNPQNVQKLLMYVSLARMNK